MQAAWAWADSLTVKEGEIRKIHTEGSGKTMKTNQNKTKSTYKPALEKQGWRSERICPFVSLNNEGVFTEWASEGS